MNLDSPHAVFVIAAYGAALLVFAGLAINAFLNWRRVKAAESLSRSISQEGKTSTCNSGSPATPGFC